MPTRLALGELADLLLETLLGAPDPDAALAGFCRYTTKRVPKSSFIGYLQDDPRALQILTRVLGASPLLGEILIRNPEYLHWLQGELDCPPPDEVDYRTEVDALLAHDKTAARRLDSLKRFQRRETLRIAARDLLDKDTLRATTEQLSDLAAVVTAGALRIAERDLAESGDAAARGSFVVIGLARLGGRELDYRQDIRLLYVHEPDDPDDEGVQAGFRELAERLTAVLTDPTAEGYCYASTSGCNCSRPAPAAAPACSLQAATRYCAGLGETGERFDLLRARPVAGDLELGRRFLDGSGRSCTASTWTRPPSRTLGRRAGGHGPGRRGPAGRRPGRGGRRRPARGRARGPRCSRLVHGAGRPDLQGGSTLSALAAAHAHALDRRTPCTRISGARTRSCARSEHRLQIAGAADTAGPARRRPHRGDWASSGDRVETTLARHRDRVHEICLNLLESRAAATVDLSPAAVAPLNRDP